MRPHHAHTFTVLLAMLLGGLLIPARATAMIVVLGTRQSKRPPQ